MGEAGPGRRTGMMANRRQLPRRPVHRRTLNRHKYPLRAVLLMVRRQRTLPPKSEKDHYSSLACS